MKLPQGKTVYHATSFEDAVNIINKGIQIVKSAWDQAELGPGFYTATTLKGAASYLSGTGAVLEFATISEMVGTGTLPPAGFDWKAAGRLSELEALCVNNQFLVNARDDPISQYKFNKSGIIQLRLVTVHLDQVPYSPEDYLNLFE